MKFKVPVIKTYSNSDIEEIIKVAACGATTFKCECYKECLNYNETRKTVS